jgi:hypothetical protein
MPKSDAVLGMAAIQFKLDEEIQSLLPPLTDEEFKMLWYKIVTDRHIDPLVVINIKGSRILADGYNRFKICQEERLPFPAREIRLPSRELAIGWVIRNQLGRRNLTDERRTYYRGKEYLNKKKGHGGDRKSNKSSPQFEDSIGKTSEQLAKNHGVSKATIERDAEFAEAIDLIAEEEGEEAREKILSGKSGKSKRAVIEQSRKQAEKDADGDGETDERVAVTDAEGTVIPEQALEAFANARILQGICREIEKIIVRVEKLAKGPGGRLLDLGSIKQQLKNTKGMLWASRATHVCPHCHGESKQCECCRGEGWTAKHVWQQAPKNAQATAAMHRAGQD